MIHRIKSQVMVSGVASEVRGVRTAAVAVAHEAFVGGRCHQPTSASVGRDETRHFNGQRKWSVTALEHALDVAEVRPPLGQPLIVHHVGYARSIRELDTYLTDGPPSGNSRQIRRLT